MALNSYQQSIEDNVARMKKATSTKDLINSYNVLYGGKDYSAYEDAGLISKVGKGASERQRALREMKAIESDPAKLQLAIQKLGLNTPEGLAAFQAKQEAQYRSDKESAHAEGMARADGSKIGLAGDKADDTAGAFVDPNYKMQSYGTAETGSETQGTQFVLTGGNLQRGAKGENVKQLQEALNSLGGYNLKLDGMYGPATEAAVRSFQQSKGIRVDGIVGPQTTAAFGGQKTSAGPAIDVMDKSVAENPEMQKYLDSLTPELRSMYDQLTMEIKSKVEQGERVNPDLTITPEMTARFMTEASAKLDPYFKELIRQHSQDLSISTRQLQEDYNKQIQREEPAFQQNLENQDIQEAEGGMAFSSGRNQREQRLITGQQNTLDDLATNLQRGTQEAGIGLERKIGSRAFSDLGLPSISNYLAQRGGFAPQGRLAQGSKRQLFAPEGGLYGEIPGQNKTAVDTESSNLEEQYRKSRLLDYSTKWGLGTTSLG